MDIKDSYLHGTVGVVKSISVDADKLTYKLADKDNTSVDVTMPTATQSANGLLSSTDKKKLDSITGPTQSIPYIVGPDTDTTAGTWTGSYSGIASYTDGLTIIYVPKVAGASTTTLNINGLGAKTCYYTNSSKLTTHYAVGTPVLLTYINGAWKRADYNENTYSAAWCETAADTAAKKANCTNFTLNNRIYLHVLIRYSNTVAGAITLNVNSTGEKPIYINGSASSASNYTLPAGTYIVYYDGTNFYFRTDGMLPGKIEKAQLSDLVTCTTGSSDVYRPIVVYASDTGKVYHNAKITANYVSGDLKATSFTGTFKGTADKVANSLILKINSGTTEGTSLYTYNGSAAKTLDIKNGTGIGFTNTAGVLSIYNSGVRSISTGSTNGTISVNTNGSSANVAVKGLGSAAYTNSSAYAVRQTLSTEDLNNVTTPGFYNCGGGNTCTNKPEGVDHFGMYVIHCAGGTYYVQILFEESDSARQWRRHCIAGTWSSWTLDKLSDTTYSVFTGATASADGTSGLVPKPTADNQGKFLKADGTWATPANTTYSVVSSSANGLAPKVINTNTATVGTAYYVLASSDGSATPSWYKLPANAFANDDTKVTQTNTTGSAAYRVLLSGNANDTTETTTARKSANLKFNPNTGNLSTETLLITKTTNAKHILFSRGKDTDYQYNYIAAPEGGYICILPNGAENNSTSGMQFTGEGLHPATTQAYSLGTSRYRWSSVYAGTLIGNLDGTYINKLTGYTKATSASDLAATDSLNTALGKLEFKADAAYDLVKGAYDGDGTIENLAEILKVLEGIKDTETIQAIIGKYLPLTGGTLTGKLTIEESNFGSLIIYRKDSANSASIQFKNGSNVSLGYLGMNTANGNLFRFSADTSTSYKIWDSGNDGSGSGLDADLLDGTHKADLFTSLANVNTEANPYSISATIGGTTKFLKVNSFSLAAQDIRDTTPTPNDFSDKSVTAWFNNQDKPADDYWYSGITVAGWNNDYRVWQLASNSNQSDSEIQLYFRTGRSDTWGAWRAVLDSSNYTSYAVKKDGTGASGTWEISITGNAATATTASKITCTEASSNNDRPIVGTDTSNQLYYTQKATVNWSTGHVKAGALTSTGQVTLHSPSGDSPSLIFQRGGLSDSLIDWRLYVTGGYLKIQNTTSENSKWVDVMTFLTQSTKSVTTPYSITATSFVKSESSDSYVLLGGGGHKTISSLSVASAVTADYLKSTKIVSGVKFNLSNASWTDTGYTFASLTTGTYAVQVTSGSNLVASGIMSVYTNLSDTAGDEIPLHVYGTAGWRPYLRTHDNKLQISSNDISVTSRTVTIKIAQIL